MSDGAIVRDETARADVMTTPPIPLVDLVWAHSQVAEDVRRGWDRVLERGRFVLGPELEAFERAFASFTRTRRCLGVGNGTDALELALRAVGVGTGDEVVVPANSFVATATAVVRAGGRPVFADVDPDGLLLDPSSATAAITGATRAIIPVHLFGQMAPVERLEPHQARGIAVIEDAAQAQGAARHGVPIGHAGAAAATSFYPGKNLGAYGDAGAVVTNVDAVAESLVELRDHGSRTKYRHDSIGFNSRLDELQAVVLLAKLHRLGEWDRLRREAAVRYDELLHDVDDVRRPTTLDGNIHSWHLYVVRVEDRDRVLGALRDDGIEASVHYPTPIHLQPGFRSFGYATGDFPVAEEGARRILSLPMFPGISREQQRYVVARLVEALRARR